MLKGFEILRGDNCIAVRRNRMLRIPTGCIAYDDFDSAIIADCWISTLEDFTQHTVAVFRTVAFT